MSKKSHRPSKNRKQQAKRQKFVLWGAAAIVVLIFAGLALNDVLTSGETPDNFEASTLYDGDIALEDYRGDVVMLNFWATWCPPCRAEMPTIQAAYTQYQDQDFTVLAVNNQESRSTIVPFVDQLNLNMPVILDPDGKLQREYNIQSYPTSIFLDHNGEIYATHNGLISATEIEGYIRQGMLRRDNDQALAQ